MSLYLRIERDDNTVDQILLDCMRGGLHNEATPYGRGRVKNFRTTLDAVKNDQGMTVGAYIDLTIQPVHVHDCGIFSRKKKYQCNCGAQEMFKKFVENVGEQMDYLTGYDANTVIGTEEERASWRLQS